MVYLYIGLINSYIVIILKQWYFPFIIWCMLVFSCYGQDCEVGSEAVGVANSIPKFRS